MKLKMKPRKFTYTAHRYLALVIALQLLAWSIGGFIFSVLDINAVRGHTDAHMITNAPLDQSSFNALPGPIQSAINNLNNPDIATITLTDRGLGPHWEIRNTKNKLLLRLDQLGTPTTLITPQDAEFIALRDFTHEATIASTTLLDESSDSIPTEYREGLLPAYQVKIDHPKNPHIYVDATLGRITARRNDNWRTFDFFWMLHTMDYKNRDNFNTPLLTIASTLAILTAITGIALWIWRLAPKKKRIAHTKLTSKKSPPSLS